MKPFLKRHAVALVLSAVFGLFVFGTLSGGARAVPGFAGIYPQAVDDQLYYFARAKDVIDGHPFLSNPYFAEHKDGSPLQVWLPDYLLATPLQWLSVGVPQGYLAYEFVCAGILFFLVYALITEVTGSRRFGLGGAAFLNVGIFATTLVRLPSPLFNFSFVVLVALAAFRFIRLRRRRDFWIGLLSFGALFYLYPYFWTFWTVVLGCFVVLDFAMRSDRLYLPVAAMLVGGGIIGIPYFLSVHAASRLPYYTETLLRIGLVFSHFPSGLAIVAGGIGTLFVLGLSWRFRRVPLDARTLLLASGTLAAMVVVNQHVVTGQNMEFSSHYLLPSVFWFALVVAYCLQGWMAHLPRGRWHQGVVALLILSVILASGMGMARLSRAAYAYTPQDVHDQSYAPIFSWLNAHTHTDDVVFANDIVSMQVPVYTADNVYSSGYGVLFFLSDQEGETRYLINHYWDAFTPDYLVAHQHEIFGAQYIDEYAHNQSKNALRRLLRLPSIVYTPIPTSALARVAAEAKMVQSQPFERILHTYRVNYVVWDTTADPTWNLGRYHSLTKVFEANGTIVYQVR